MEEIAARRSKDQCAVDDQIRPRMVLGESVDGHPDGAGAVPRVDLDMRAGDVDTCGDVDVLVAGRAVGDAHLRELHGPHAPAPRRDAR